MASTSFLLLTLCSWHSTDGSACESVISFASHFKCKLACHLVVVHISINLMFVSFFCKLVRSWQNNNNEFAVRYCHASKGQFQFRVGERKEGRLCKDGNLRKKNKKWVWGWDWWVQGRFVFRTQILLNLFLECFS